MKKLTRNLIPVMMVAAWAGLALPQAATAAEVIYNNSVNSLNSVFYFGNTEVGDEIGLGGTERNLIRFSFQYSTAPGFTGLEGVSAVVRFYENTGAAFNGYASPAGTAFWESTSFSFLAGD